MSARPLLAIRRKHERCAATVLSDDKREARMAEEAKSDVNSTLQKQLTIGDRQISFACFKDLFTSGTDFIRVLWNPPQASEASNDSTGTQWVQFGVSAKTFEKNGYVAIGFHPHLRMVPARAIVSCLPKSTSSPSVIEYRMTAKNKAGVQPATEPVIRGGMVEYSGEQVAFTFEIPLHELNAQGDEQKVGVIVAEGPQPERENALAFHSDFASDIIVMKPRS
jgi:hypothetical protein